MDLICDQCLRKNDNFNTTMYQTINGTDYKLIYCGTFGMCRFCGHSDEIRLFQLHEPYFPIETEIRGMSLLMSGAYDFLFYNLAPVTNAELKNNKIMDGINKLLYVPIYFIIGYYILKMI